MGVIAKGIPRGCQAEQSNPRVLGIPAISFPKKSTLKRCGISRTFEWNLCPTLESMSLTVKRPRTRSAAARQVINAHERDLVTNQNV